MYWETMQGCAILFADVEDGDDVGVVTEAGHGLGFAAYALQAQEVEAVGLDHGEGDVAVEAGVVGQVDALAPALAQERAHFVAAGGEGGWQGREDGGGCERRCLFGWTSGAGGSGEEEPGILIQRVQR